MKTHYSCAELAALKLPGYPTNRQNWHELAKREGWELVEVKGRGGKGGIRREYLPSKTVQKQIDIQRAVTHPDPVSRALSNVVEAMNQVAAEKEAAEASRHQRGEANLMELGGLSERETLTFKAHNEIVDGWKVWFTRAQPLKKSNSWAPFSTVYNRAEIPVSKAVREAYPEISPRSVQRWVLDHEKGNFSALVDHRNGAKLKNTGVFDLNILLAQTAVKIMMDRPGIKTGQLDSLLKTASVCRETGEVLFTPPSIHQVYRFQTQWQKDNAEVYLKATNPDAWKNKYMLALGSADEDVTELNGRWEMDATPADWLLLDEDGKKRRYTVSVIIDVWSRRMMIVVSRTPKTQTHCFALRLALLAWGVPKEIVTDNGADYLSDHFQLVLSRLGIVQRICNPFSPEEKPLVERVIGTLNHSILELLPNFAGHSVADRKAIEARQSFADRLMKKGEVVDFSEAGDIDGAKMQEIINKWNTGCYEQRTHGTLGVNPFAKAASWTGEVRRIENERALDILLARPTEGGTRTLQKKGIKIDGAWFIAGELGRVEMGSVLDIYETEDLGRVIVYYRKNFLCIAENPMRTGMDRKAIAAIASASQNKRIREANAQYRKSIKGKPSTDDLLHQHLNDSAAAAGKLVSGTFGAKVHISQGLTEAAKAVKAQEGIQPSSQAEKLREEARAAMAKMEYEKVNPAKIVSHPSAAQNVSIVAGMTPEAKYDYWLELEAKNKRDGDLENKEERHWHKVFPNSTTWRAQKALRENGLRDAGK